MKIHGTFSLDGASRDEGSPVNFNCQSMIRKSGYRFSEKIMLKQRDQIMIRFNLI